MKFFLLIVIALSGISCATPYQEMGYLGGVRAQQMTNDMFRISARGNAYTDANTIQDYMVLKAAETTKQMGATHFMVVSGRNAERRDYSVSSGTAQTTLVGDQLVTTYSPGSVSESIKPGEDAYIRIIDGSNGKPVPPGSVSADEVIRFVGARVRRG